MTGPRRLFRSNNPLTALDYEIAQETACALGRMGRRLDDALRAVEALDAKRSPDSRNVRECGARQALVTEASVALRHFIVQREACGLRDARQLMRDYRVPHDVHDRAVCCQPHRQASA
jgi:hypothetical protein